MGLFSLKIVDIFVLEPGTGTRFGLSASTTPRRLFGAISNGTIDGVNDVLRLPEQLIAVGQGSTAHAASAHSSSQPNDDAHPCGIFDGDNSSSAVNSQRDVWMLSCREPEQATLKPSGVMQLGSDYFEHCHTQFAFGSTQPMHISVPSDNAAAEDTTIIDSSQALASHMQQALVGVPNIVFKGDEVHVI